MARWSSLIVLGCLLLAPLAFARAADGELCAAAIRAAERAASLPRGLLGAVSFAESGRRDPDRPRAVAWPWTVNNAGDGRYFDSKREAIAHVEALRAQGKRNIDVGCMQINLMHHPAAFASLQAAFEPATNVAYGAGFLAQLKQETGSWARAIERYHTADPARGQAYRARVFDRWQDVRLADATGGAAGSGRSAGEPAAGPRLAGKPGAVPLRRQPASSTRLGFAHVAPAPARIAALRPPRGRSMVGLVRTDGRIAGSGLRLGPRRSTLRAMPDGERPAADAGLQAAHRPSGGRAAAETPPAPDGKVSRQMAGRGTVEAGAQPVVRGRSPIASHAGGA